FLLNGPSNGYRWEGGYMDPEADRGFFLSAFRLYDFDQRIGFPNVFVPFQAPPTGPFNTSLLQGFVDPNGAGRDADLNNNGVFGRAGNPVDFGDLATLPVVFTQLATFTHREIWSGEANYIWRLRPGYKGTTWELFVGPRYMKFYEQFLVSGT